MMKKGILVGSILTCFVTSHLYASQNECSEVPDGAELAQSLENKMYDEAEALLQEFRSDIASYRINCDSSQDMFEQTQISILTYEDRLSDLKEELTHSEISKSVDCSKVPNTLKLASAFKSGDKSEIETSYEAYKSERKDYLDQCTLHESYIVVFEQSASFDEEYIKWEKTLQI